MACSRTPQWMFAPAAVRLNEPPPGTVVLVDSARSAEPPIIVGRYGAAAAMTCAPAARVASFDRCAGSNAGIASASPGAGAPPHAHAHSIASAGFVRFYF